MTCLTNIYTNSLHAFAQSFTDTSMQHLRISMFLYSLNPDLLLYVYTHLRNNRHQHDPCALYRIVQIANSKLFENSNSNNFSTASVRKQFKD